MKDISVYEDDKKGLQEFDLYRVLITESIVIFFWGFEISTCGKEAKPRFSGKYFKPDFFRKNPQLLT